MRKKSGFTMVEQAIMLVPEFENVVPKLEQQITLRGQSTLPVKHYHIIFTVPHELNAVCLHNQRMYYDLLFAAVWNTLYSFGYSHYGSETGAVCVLHTWGQNLSLHPHIHCIVPAVGYTLEAECKEIGHSGKYLYPVHQLSDTFKGKFLDSL